MSDESHLMRQLNQGDETAWSQVFPTLWSVARRAAATPMAGLCRTETDDVAIETLGELAKRIVPVSTLVQLRALTATIAFRKAISLARRKSAAKRCAPDPLPTTDAARESGDTISHLDEVQLHELLCLLTVALSDLDPETQSLLLDKHVAGLSYHELAEKYRKPVGTVAARIARGLVKVRNSLKESPELLKELSAFLR
jgi:RNA polymerase sigma factor (sigma-70 family)